MNLMKMTELELCDLLTDVKIIRQERIIEFIKSLETDDFKNAQRLIDLGINWSDPALWDWVDQKMVIDMKKVNFFNKVKESEVGSFLVSFRTKPSSQLSHMQIFNREDRVPLLLKDVLDHFCYEKSKRLLLSHSYDDKLFGYLNSVKKLDGNEFKRMSIHFRQLDIDKSQHKNFINILSENEMYVNFFIRKTNLHGLMFIEKNVKELFYKAIANEVIYEYVIGGKVEEVKFLESLGKRVDYNEAKGLISKVFSSMKEEFNPMREHIIQTVEDITFGNQVILRTLLNKPDNIKLEVLNLVLDRYDVQIQSNKEIIRLLNAALVGRDPSECVNHVKKRVGYLELVDSMSTKNVNNFKVKI